jgi:NADPH-dependent curcumin reductase CurA
MTRHAESAGTTYPEAATAITLTKGGAHPSFDAATVPVRPPAEGEVLVRNLLTSVDPHMGVAMRDLASYGHAFPEGEPVTADSLGVVVASQHPGVEPGAWMLNSSGWREYATVPGAPDQVADPGLGDDVAWMSVLGMTGITAWTAVREIGNVRAGETVVVTAAAGAVGGVAVQLAKDAGARVVGIAGGERKRRHLQDVLRADTAIDYTAADLAAQLRQAAGAIDVVIDLVGGSQLAAAVPLLANHARVALVGRLGALAEGPRAAVDLSVAIPRRVRFEGFVIIDSLPRWPAIRRELAFRLQAGRLQAVSTVTGGLKEAPAALAELFTSEAPHLGKRLIRIAR